MIHGLTTAGLGTPDYELALRQHDTYIQALEACDLNVQVLDADEAYPDSTFIEDVALLTPEAGIITRPGAPSRRGEIDGLEEILSAHYSKIESITHPGTLDAGDVMMVGNHYYIGLSGRTNEAGADQLIGILKYYDLDASKIQITGILHLKSAVAYLENRNLLLTGRLKHHPSFQQFNKLGVVPKESYAANCIWVNGRVIVPSGYPVTKRTIQMEGYNTIAIDVSEFRKLDGGLSCLSLRF